MSTNKSKYFSVVTENIVQANSQQDALSLVSGKRITTAQVLTTMTGAERISATEARSFSE